MAVRKIDCQTQSHPAKENHPRFDRYLNHQIRAKQNAHDGNKRPFFESRLYRQNRCNGEENEQQILLMWLIGNVGKGGDDAFLKHPQKRQKY